MQLRSPHVQPELPVPSSLLLCLLQEVRSWRAGDSPMANGAGAAAHRRREREPEREEKKEEEKLKTSQVGRMLGCVGWQEPGR